MASTLEQLESDVWPEPDVHTSLIATCHRLRKIPIDDLSAGDVRMLMGQRIGVRHLAPVAVRLLDAAPMLDATFYPGDLLTVVLRADANHFRGFPTLRDQLVSIASRAQQSILELGEVPRSLNDLVAILPEYEQ